MTVPKLRFKEFINDWKITSLGSEIGISSASRVLKEQWRASGVPFFRTSDVISIFKSEENQKVFISYDLFETLSNKSGRIKKGDLLITGGGSIGIPYLKKDNSPLYFKDADLLWLKSSEKINGEFLYNFFQSQSFKVYLKSISHTGTISHFTIEQAKTTPINLPSKEEQTKIANFLTTVDKKISQLNEQHQLMIQYKKGVMQKIFSQEIRFKDDNGEEFGEWEERTLGEVVDVFDNLRVPVTSSERIAGKTPYYGANGIQDYVEGYTHKGEFVLLAEDGANDLINYPVSYVNGQIWVNNHAHVLSGKSGVLNNRFLTYRIASMNISNYLVGGSRAKLNGSTMKTIKLYLPTFKEQTEIANFLTSIDYKINNLFAQLQTVKEWRKGLLQQMFV